MVEDDDSGEIKKSLNYCMEEMVQADLMKIIKVKRSLDDLQRRLADKDASEEAARLGSIEFKTFYERDRWLFLRASPLPSFAAVYPNRKRHSRTLASRLHASIEWFNSNSRMSRKPWVCTRTKTSRNR